MVDNDGLSKLPEYQYHLKDHLGNVRLTFSASPETESSTATLETAHEEEEYATFLRYAETTKINSNLFDHTGNGDTHYAVRLNGTANERIGLARSLAVMTGDTVRAEVYAKYLDPDPDNWTAALQSLMAAIAAGTAPAGTVIEAVPPSGGDGFPFEGLLDAAKANDTGTRAYLNILLFDEGLTFLDAAYVPLTAAAKEDGTNVPHEKLALEFVVQQPGYVYIYFSNDNPQPLEVFFDDFTVEHAHSAIVQADDYYPFGMTFNGYRRENSVANKFLYNGKELQTDLDLGWMDYGARMYQPELGRFTTIDPWAEKYMNQGSYNYAFNNPIRFTDFMGMGPEDEVLQVTSTDNMDVITETSTQTNTTTRTVKKGTDEYNELLGKSTITNGSNGIGDEITVTESTTTTVETSIAVEYDDQGNVVSRNESQKTTVDSKTNVAVSDQYGGEAGGFSNSSSNTSVSNSPELSSGLSRLAGDAINYRGENGVSMTNNNEYASQIAKQRNLVNALDKYTPAAGVLLFRYGSAPSLIFGLGTMGLQKSAERGLQNLVNLSPPCNNCTKRYNRK